MNQTQRRSAFKAARLYLEMRGHRLLEQGWSSGRHKIDLIATKNNVIEFINISYAPENGNVDVAESARANTKLKMAEEAWVTDNKFSGTTATMVVEILGDSYAVLSFNEV
ncbi:MAG TPA: YraN family protein [Candidatus Saccharimonadales bacterium]|nr:YraN family protein [Candidatus Saccharimonadales bacterium]